MFVAIGDVNISWSADGKDWTKATVQGGTPKSMSRLTFTGTKFVAAPYLNDASDCLTFESSDGKTWKPTKTKVPGTAPISTLSTAAKKVFVGVEGGTVYALSATAEPGTSDWVKVDGLDYGPVGGDDTLAVTTSLWSTDGVSWKPATKAADLNASRIIKLK